MIIPVVQLLHLLYLWVLEFIPNPEFFIYPYLASSGWLPYRNIIDQHFPGLWLLPVNFFTIGFNNPTSYKVLLLLVVLIQSVFLVWLARKLFPRTRVALYTVLFFAVWQPFFAGSNLWIDLFLPLFTLPAFYFTVRKNWLLTGLFLGLGLLFKQNLVVLLLVPLYFIFKSPNPWKKLLDMVFGIILPWIPVILFIRANNLWPDFYYWTVVFNLTVYPKLSALAPSVTDLIKIIFPLGLAVAAFIRLRKTGKFIYLIFIWSLLSVIASLSRFDLDHFQPAVPFLCLGLGIWADSLKPKFRYLLIGLSVFWSLWLTLRHQPLLQTAYFDKNFSTEISEIKKLTRPGDVIFVLGSQPILYSSTGTFPPDNYFAFSLPWYFSGNINKNIYNLFVDPPKLVVFDPESSVDGRNISQYAPALIKYIKLGYHQVDMIGHDIILIPNQ
jgi:hypothetical protein